MRATAVAWSGVSRAGTGGTGIPSPCTSSPAGTSASRAISPASAIRRRVGIVVDAARTSSAAVIAPSSGTAARIGLLAGGAGGCAGDAPDDQACDGTAGGHGEPPGPVRRAAQRALGPRRHDEAQAGGDRRRVVPGHPERQLAQLVGNGRLSRPDRPARRVVRCGWRALVTDDHPDHAAPSQRACHERADGTVELLGNEVVERPIERAGVDQKMDLHTAAGRRCRRVIRQQ